MSWRPENWDDIKFQECMNLTKGGGTYSDIYEVFEAGAEVMFNALKEGSKPTQPPWFCDEEIEKWCEEFVKPYSICLNDKLREFERAIREADIQHYEGKPIEKTPFSPGYVDK